MQRVRGDVLWSATTDVAVLPPGGGLAPAVPAALAIEIPGRVLGGPGVYRLQFAREPYLGDVSEEPVCWAECLAGVQSSHSRCSSDLPGGCYGSCGLGGTAAGGELRVIGCVLSF